ncbi:MAG: hypothetical protein ACI90V_006609 [Bacillariaceae sp.]|jgi:hypothetical protein
MIDFIYIYSNGILITFICHLFLVLIFDLTRRELISFHSQYLLIAFARNLRYAVWKNDVKLFFLEIAHLLLRIMMC